MPVRDERNKKQEGLKIKYDRLISLMQERPSVKKLLAYEKEVAEQFAPGAGSVALFIYASLTLVARWLPVV